MEKLFIVILLACLLLNLIISDIQRKKDKQKYINLRKKYNDLAMRTGNDHIALSFVENSQIDAIRQMKENGKMVEAVKMVRELADLDLLEAKEYVDQL